MQRVEVQDRASTGKAARVEAQLAAAVERFAEAGHGPRRPLRGVLEPLGVPGFTETQVELHVLHLDAAAAGAPWLPGLLARQVAHAALADLGHVSHDPVLLQESFAAARARSRDLSFLAAVGAFNHHVRDVYADDLAAFVDAESLGPFLDHLADAAARADGTAAEAAVEAGYAAGTLRRRGAPLPDALAARLRAMPEAARLAATFEGLAPDPEGEALERAVVEAVAALPGV